MRPKVGQYARINQLRDNVGDSPWWCLINFQGYTYGGMELVLFGPTKIYFNGWWSTTIWPRTYHVNWDRIDALFEEDQLPDEFFIQQAAYALLPRLT